MVKVLDTILSQSAYSAEIDVPLEKIDIADWLFNLPEAEYLRCCPPDHIAAGVTWTDDGRRMSINVEQIGSGLVVQHYVAEVAEPAYCRMNSISDVFTANGRTQVNVVWELMAEKIDDGRTRYTNKVTAHPTDAFMRFIESTVSVTKRPRQPVSPPAATTTAARRRCLLPASPVGHCLSKEPLR